MICRMNTYSSDSPINSKKYDSLGRLSFAEKIVSILNSLDKERSFIIGLYASWGSGKTSTINLIEQRINDSTRKNKPVLVKLNAWELNGNGDAIFHEILKNIYEKVTDKAFGGFREKTSRFFGKLSRAKLPIDSTIEIDLNSGGRKETSIYLGRITASMDYVSRILQSSYFINKIKIKTQEEIKESGKKVIVVIDDIDRLESQSIADLMHIIAQIANYAGIVYILPFDNRYVASAIEQFLPQGASGQEYLEKIIQIPLELPKASRSSLNRMLAATIESICKQHSIVLEENEIERFRLILEYHNLGAYIQSPRDINRLNNSLLFRLPLCHGEMNMVDVIVLEIIRLFDDGLYERIKDNGDMLIEKISSKYGINDDASRKQDLQDTFGGDDRWLEIVQELFPFVAYTLKGYGNINENDLRYHQRIASDYYFEKFFASLDEIEDISDVAVMNLLTNSVDEASIRKNLHIINENNIATALWIISKRHSVIKNKIVFCTCLLDLIEGMPTARSSSLTLTALERVLFTIDDILASESKDEKTTGYISLINHLFDQDRIDTFSHTIDHVIHYSTNKGNHSIELKKDQIQQYKTTALQFIRRFAKDDKLPLLSQNGSSIRLYIRWAEFSTREETSRYLEKKIQSADDAISFILQFVGTWHTIGKSDYTYRDLTPDIMRSIDTVINIDTLHQIIISDPRYGTLGNIQEVDLVLFERPTTNSIRTIAKVGNEKSPELKEAIIKQFIYFFNKRQEAKE